MHIGFDNGDRLARRIYYFEYKGIRFKLIQNDGKTYRDVLLTLIDDMNNRAAQAPAYETAGEFISALSWQNGSRMKLGFTGGPSVRKGFTLRRARCTNRSFMEIPFHGSTLGCDISVIPKIETNQQRIALTLCREAKSSNNYFLSFLFYWQVLEIGPASAHNWVDKTYRRRGTNGFYINPRDLQSLGIGGKSIGDYLQDDCRDAIAHIKRRPGKTALRFDNQDETTRMSVSARVAETFAKFYVKNELQLNKRMFLVRKNRSGGFPIYLDEDALRRHFYRPAYPTPALSRVFGWKRKRK